MVSTMDDPGSIIAGITTANRVFYNRFTEIAVGIAPTDTLVYRFPQIATYQVHILTDLQKYASHTGILTDGDIFCICDFIIFNNLI